MATSLEKLLAIAQKVRMNPEQQEQQRRSFAYGTANIENVRITKSMVDEVASRLKRPSGSRNG